MTKNLKRLRIALQKSGRLNDDCIRVLERCGLKIRFSKQSLLCHVENLALDILLVRDDDIPTLVLDGVCDIGIVGENVLQEKTLEQESKGSFEKVDIIQKLGFSRCRLSIALPTEKSFLDPTSLEGLRIATSYPFLLQDYLKRQKVRADIMTISGSVEIAPSLDMADAICDLVSTGRTLEEHNLKEVDQVMMSEAVLIKTPKYLNPDKQSVFDLLVRRIESVLKAEESKYILFHAPLDALSRIQTILPGFETPTILPLQGVSDKVAVHVVSNEKIFWSTLEKLKEMGASSILVLPIEKMLN